VTGHEFWMARALDLAARGIGSVEPNPCVGAVVLNAAGVFAGDGWHQRYGGPHAEVFALAAAGESARGGTLYVTLEPCCHHGKTPPCTDAVLASGVARVVVAMADPFPRVNGGGLAILRQAGVAVEVGVREAEARALNAPYLTLLGTGRPWVVAKWAMTLDGKLATRTGDSKWVSNPESRARVHELRGQVDAVVVGRGTVVADDPLLTARPPGPRTPARVVVCGSGDLPAACQLTATARAVPVVVYTAAANAGKLAAWADAGAEVVGLPSVGNTLSPLAILDDLGRRRFTRVLVEGGAKLLGSLHDAGAIDETWVFLAPKLFGGVTAPGPVGGTGVGTVAESRVPVTTHTEVLGDNVLIRSVFTTFEPEPD